MGSGSSVEDRELSALSRQIDEQLKKDEANPDSAIKLLLLGAGEAGKSTVLKQMRILHKGGFTDAECEIQAHVIRANVIQSICEVTLCMETLKIPFENPTRLKDMQHMMNVHKLRSDTAQFTSETLRSINQLLNDPGFQKCFQLPICRLKLSDSTVYFFEAFDRISQPTYLPSTQDMLRSRVQTTGIIEVEFQIKGQNFRVFDVGGQRSERRKWLHCFDNVHAIIFVTSLSEYDQILAEEDKTNFITNRMHESLLLFSSICNTQLFTRTSIMLFLNKKDIFAEKIKVANITYAFPEYAGAQDYDECAEYIRSRFAHENRNIKRDIYSHFTCSTDTSQIEFVLNAALDIILVQSMQRIGFA